MIADEIVVGCDCAVIVPQILIIEKHSPALLDRDNRKCSPAGLMNESHANPSAFISKSSTIRLVAYSVNTCRSLAISRSTYYNALRQFHLINEVRQA